MKVVIALLSIASISAFAPSARFGSARLTTARSFGVDPSHFHDLPQHFESIQTAFSSMTLSDAVAGLADAVTDAPFPAGDAAPAADDGNGWFGFLTGPIAGLLYLIHSAFQAVGMESNAWGVSIVALTVLIKVVTFPLTKTQLESTNKMQALQPSIKAVQAKYQSNPEVMNQKIAELYQANEVNPLAGCLPAIVQIPVFIGLYRAVLTLAKENKLDEPFLFLPNLEGPTYGADPAHGSDWILSGWVNGAPSLGWEATAAFLVLPVFLVISQYVSMQIMQPQNKDPQQESANFVLKLLPLMIGWFSLNVPAALCIYWVANNIITTATTVLIRNSMVPAAAIGDVSSTTVETTKSTVFAPSPLREKPQGFSSPTFDGSDGIKPITPIDAEIVNVETSEPTGDMSGSGMDAKKRGSKKKKN